MVAPTAVEPSIPSIPSDPGALYARRVAGIGGSMIDASTSLLQRQDHDVIRLAMGSPAADAVPSGLFAELAREVAASQPAAFDYGPTEGDRFLRAALSDVLAERGQCVADEQLMITSGGMQGLDLVAKLFVQRDDLVVIESPTYTNGALTLSSYEGRLLEIPVDDDGLCVEALADAVARHGGCPKLIYTVPNFQNPSGRTLSLARRRQLIDLAARWGSLILEDDPYGWLAFSGSTPPSLWQLAEENQRARVISVHTFSKILAPGLRVGWLTAHPSVIRKMVDARQGMDTCTNTLQQRIVAEFLARGHMADHLAKLRAEYRRRKEAMQAALETCFSELDVQWTDPQGGFFLWLTLPSAVDTRSMFPTAVEEGVAYIPGAAFSPSGRFGSALRLAFSAEGPERAARGVGLLAKIVKQRLLRLHSNPDRTPSRLELIG